jgi:hypothetical protein
VNEKPHEHDAPCYPCRHGRHGECVRVRTYGEDGVCRYVCHCDHKARP